MAEAAPSLRKHMNLNDQPVMSVAAYGPDRPVASNQTREGKDTNRRIEIRFIMVAPKDQKEIAIIRDALGTIGGQP